MFLLSDDDKWTIVRIATIAQSSAAFYGQKARDQEVEHIIRRPNIAGSSNKRACKSENSNMGSNSEFRHASYARMKTLLKTSESDLVDIGKGFSTVGYVTKPVSILLLMILEYCANMLQSICRDILFAADDISPLPAADQIKASIQGIADVVVQLKLHLPCRIRVRVECATDLINHLIKLPAYEEFGDHVALHDFEENYRSLDPRSKHCLLCFSVFPDGYGVEKTSMMYWCVGDGLIDAKSDGEKAAEQVANEIVKKFLDFGFC